MKTKPTHSIITLLDYARLSPSVHNTQPWKFKIDGNEISLYIEERRILEYGDPTKRELWLSIGACFETLIQAASGLGLLVKIKKIQNRSINKPVAVIEVQAKEPNKDQPQLLSAIQRRHSYRGRLKQATLSENTLKHIKTCQQDLIGVTIKVSSDPQIKSLVAQLTNKGMQLALSSSDFRHELAQLIHYNWTTSKLGMPGYVLNQGAIGSVCEKWSIRLGLGLASKAQADQRKISEASCLAFILTEGDVPKYWFEAGRAYLRLGLYLTQTGLAHSTIAAPVEAATFHEDIEQALDSKERLQMIVRIGKPRKKWFKKSAPRLSVKELLT